MSQGNNKKKPGRKVTNNLALVGPKMLETLHRHRSSIVIALLAIAVLTVYWQVTNHEFVSYDDNVYIYENAVVQSGFNWNSIVWAFTTGTQANWHPLTWLSIILDYELFGLNAGLHHLMSALIHSINTILVFIVFWRLTGGFWQSAFVAALFGLHPLHVESVAWASERKDVLSAAFWMLATLAYLRYVKRPGIKRYMLVILLFVLGLLAKPMVVTLPFVLLLLDFWPLKRLEIDSQLSEASDLANASPQEDSEQKRRRIFLKLVLEKVPFLILSVISSIVTFIAQRSGGAVFPLEKMPVLIRVENAFLSYAMYIWKMIWPFDLAFFYPHPGYISPLWTFVVAGAIIIGLTILLLWLGKKRHYLTVGWLWYLGTLVPVIGIVQVGIQGLADRYTYIPFIGLSIILAWGAQDLLARWQFRKIALATAAGLSLLFFSILTWYQVGVWKDNITLFSHAVNVTERNYLALTNLALAEEKLGRSDDAIQHYKQAIEYAPAISDIHNYLGIALAKKGENLEASTQYAEAIRIKPEYQEAHFNLGIVLDRLGKTDEAISHFNEALLLKPEDAEVHNNLGAALGKQGKVDEAIEHFEEAVRIKPDYPSALYNLGTALLGRDRNGEAIDRLSEVVRLKPDHAKAHYNLGLALESAGRPMEALRHYDRALSLSPTYSEALFRYSRLVRMQQQSAQSSK